MSWADLTCRASALWDKLIPFLVGNGEETRSQRILRRVRIGIVITACLVTLQSVLLVLGAWRNDQQIEHNMELCRHPSALLTLLFRQPDVGLKQPPYVLQYSTEGGLKTNHQGESLGLISHPTSPRPIILPAMNPSSCNRSWARACSLALVGLYMLGGLQGALCFEGPKDYRQKFKVGREDVVVSMPVDQKHLTVAKGSRAWRKVHSD